MARYKIILGSSVCLLIAVFVGQSLSQARRANRTGDLPERPNLMRRISPQERRREYQQRAAERREQMRVERENRLRQARATAADRSDEAIKQALGATEEQWKVIKPKFKKVQTFMNEARVSIAPVSYGFGGGAGAGGRIRAGGRAGGGFGGSAGGRGGAGGGGGFGAGAGAGGRAGGGRTRQSENINSEETRSWSRYGWRWSKPSASKNPARLTRGEKICEELLELLQDKDANPEAIRQKIGALRNIREEAKGQLVKARQELREVLTPHQEATFVLMGWLN